MKSGEEGLSYFYPEDLLPEWWKVFRLLREKTQEAITEKPKPGMMCEAGFEVKSAAEEIHIVFYLREEATGVYADIDSLTALLKQPPEESKNIDYYLRYEIIPNGKTKKLKYAGCVYLVKQNQKAVLPDGKEVWNLPGKREDSLRLAGKEISCLGKSSIAFPNFYFEDLNPPVAISKPPLVKKDW